MSYFETLDADSQKIAYVEIGIKMGLQVTVTSTGYRTHLLLALLVHCCSFGPHDIAEAGGDVDDYASCLPVC